ncbi:hypothetical protein [Marinobacter halodurans]|uniref:hypothetical protein n=1 Tax=Marinobacter halodurans TaxID=2528979 RepID=UPI0013F14894|nr:hypothetical protein [Marinobacter halodurans]
MKWIVVLVVVAVVAVWLYRGRRKNDIEDPEAKRFEEHDYYLSPEEEKDSDDRRS